MKTIEDVHISAAAEGLSKDEALKRVMGPKSKEFVEEGAGLYAKA